VIMLENNRVAESLTGEGKKIVHGWGPLSTVHRPPAGSLNRRSSKKRGEGNKREGLLINVGRVGSSSEGNEIESEFAVTERVSSSGGRGAPTSRELYEK